MQLEKHNERLKEALIRSARLETTLQTELTIRLRDVSSDAEKEYKAKISDLEKELSSQEDLQSSSLTSSLSAHAHGRPIRAGRGETCECRSAD